MEPNDTNAKPQAPKAPLYTVYDMNQRGAVPRMHDVIVKIYPNGDEPDVVTYKLYSDSDKGCPMSQDHAFKFLCDPAFKVIGPNGNRLMPITKFDPSKPITALKDNELVVTYNELSRDSLMKRVKMIPGSEDVKPNSTVDELAAFMINYRKHLAGMTDGDRTMAEKMAAAGIESIGEEGLDGLFGDRKAA